jgi:hypothetical protein
MARGMANLKVALDDPASTNLTEAVLEWLGSAASSAGLRETPLKARQAPDQNQTAPIIDYAFDAISCSDAQDAGNVTTKDVFDYIVSTTHDVSPMCECDCQVLLQYDFVTLVLLSVGPIGMPKVGRVRCHRWPVRAAERYAGPWNKKLSNRILTIGVWFSQALIRRLDRTTEPKYNQVMKRTLSHHTSTQRTWQIHLGAQPCL